MVRFGTARGPAVPRVIRFGPRGHDVVRDGLATEVVYLSGVARREFLRGGTPGGLGAIHQESLLRSNAWAACLPARTLRESVCSRLGCGRCREVRAALEAWWKCNETVAHAL